MKLRSRSALLSTLVALGLLFVSACSGGNASSSGEAPSSSNNGAAGSAGASSPAASEPGDGGQKVVIRHTMFDNEFTPEMIAEFEKEHPNIKIETVAADYNKLMAMMAAGNGPDIIRTNLTELPGYVIKGMARDLTAEFDSSTVFQQDDFLPVVNQFRYDTAKGLQGEGALYGYPKDWSPDFTLYYNKKMFEAAGVPLPSGTEPMTWSELVELAKKLTIKNGDKVTQYGLAYFNGNIAANQDLLNIQLMQAGSSAYSPDFKTADYTKPEVMNLLSFWADTAKSAVGPNPKHQETDWGGQLFVDNKAAIIIAGYWFSGFLKDNQLTKDRLSDFGVAPAPVMDPANRISPTVFGTGAIIYSQSKHPKEAWAVYEWFFGGKPAEERAIAGYGLPGSRKLMELLPQTNEFDKMNFDFVQSELQYNGGTAPFNPYLTYQAVNAVFDKYFTPVYFDKDTVDGAANKMTEELNVLIREGMQLIGVN